MHFIFMLASSSSGAESPDSVAHFGIIFIMFAIVLIAGKIGNIVERFGQPGVIGELLAGIFLAILGYLGWGLIGDIAHNQIISFLASFGALILLFSIGLESKIADMRKVGASAALVAVIGVVIPFVLGAYILGPIFFGDQSENARLFLGASLVATSVGITASVFRSAKIIKTRAAKTVIGAAVIDDVLGLIVLAIVSSLAAGGQLSGGDVSLIALKSFGFLAGALVIGSYLAKPLSRLFSLIHTGVGMKVSLALGFALILGFLAEYFGLEPIIGAFAAGLLLEAVHFERFEQPEIVRDLESLNYVANKDQEKVQKLIGKHSHAHVEDLIGNIGLVFIPLFFVYTGLQIDIASLLNVQLYIVSVVIAVFAIAGKLVAGLAAQGSKTEKLLVGTSMVPRGEVGLIFAATGRSLGVLGDDLFSVIILVVIITTFIAPPIITRLAKQLKKEEELAKA